MGCAGPFKRMDSWLRDSSQSPKLQLVSPLSGDNSQPNPLHKAYSALVPAKRCRLVQGWAGSYCVYVVLFFPISLYYTCFQITLISISAILKRVRSRCLTIFTRKLRFRRCRRRRRLSEDGSSFESSKRGAALRKANPCGGRRWRGGGERDRLFKFERAKGYLSSSNSRSPFFSLSRSVLLSRGELAILKCNTIRL